MRTRVVFVAETTEFGGAEKHLLELVRALDGSHQSVIWYHPVDFYSRFLRGCANARVLARLSRITPRTIGAFWFRLVALRPTVVVFVKGVFDAYPWFAYLAARLSGAKRVIVIEQLIGDPAPAPVPGAGIAARVRRAVGWRGRHMTRKRLEGRLAHFTVCVSEAVRQRLVVEYGYPPRKTLTIHNGVDLASFRPLTPEPAGPSRSSAGDPMHIVCIARLSWVKRHDLLLDALALVATTGFPWHCTIVGGGPLEAELKARAESLGLSSVVDFAGHVDDVRPYLEQADLAVLSSEKEGLPLSLVEAMAFGVPSVVTDVGGNREIVLHEQTGLVVEFGSAEKLAAAITHLLGHPDERRRMGDEARKRAYEGFDAAQQLERYSSLLSV